jgi:hypothetical protein
MPTKAVAAAKAASSGNASSGAAAGVNMRVAHAAFRSGWSGGGPSGGPGGYRSERYRGAQAGRENMPPAATPASATADCGACSAWGVVGGDCGVCYTGNCGCGAGATAGFGRGIPIGLREAAAGARPSRRAN